MVTPWEKAVGIIGEKLSFWKVGDSQNSRKGVTSACSVGESYHDAPGRSVRSTTLDIMGMDYRLVYFWSAGSAPWPWPIEPPPRTTRDDDFDGRPASCSVNWEDDEATRQAMKMLFGVDTFALIEEGSCPRPTLAELANPNDIRARERAVKLASAIAVAALEYDIRAPVFAKTLTPSGGVVVRGCATTVGCCTEFETMAQSHQVADIRLPRVVQALRVRCPTFRLDDAVVLVKFVWTRKTNVSSSAWRRRLISSPQLEVLGSLRRGKPLWGPLFDPIDSLIVIATWRERAVAGTLDEAAAPFSTFETKDADVLAASTRLATIASHDDKLVETPLADHLRTLGAALLIDFPDDAVLGGHVASDVYRRDKVQLRAVSCAESLRQRAESLREKSGTLSQARLVDFIADLFAQSCRTKCLDSEENGNFYCAAAQLALRLGALSSLQAMSLLWRAFVRKYRSFWEEDEDSDDEDYCQKDDDTMHGAAVYVGSKLLVGDATTAVGRLESASMRSGLSRLLRLLDTSILVSKTPSAASSPPSQAFQAPAPKFGVEAMLPAHAAERRALALLASDAAVFKSTLDDFESFISALPRPWLYPLDVDPDVVAEIWDAVRATPPAEALPFFKVETEAEHALHRLEVAHPSWVLSQAFRDAAAVSLSVLANQAKLTKADHLSSVRGAFDAATIAVAALDLPDVDDSSVKLTLDDAFFTSRLPAAVDAVAACETHLARALSLLTRGAPPDLVELLLLRGNAVRLDEARHRSQIAQLLVRFNLVPPLDQSQSHGASTDDDDENDAEDVDFPPPDSRDYLLFCEADTSPANSEDCASLLKLPHRVYAHCEAEHSGRYSHTCAFAISDADGLPPQLAAKEDA